MSSPRDSERRVVITGLGVVSPIGIGHDEYWNSLQAGRSGISRIDMLSHSALPQHIGGEIKDFVASKYVRQKKSIKVMCREIQLGVASASLALDDAGMAEGVVDPTRLGVDFGANLMLSPPEDLSRACFTCIDDEQHKFAYDEWGKRGMSDMFPLWLLKYLPNMPACHIGIAADARGPNNSITLDDASGNLVMGEALRVIARGNADIMIAGATGTRLHAIRSLHAAMWDSLASCSEDPTDACRPFDLNRNGQVVAEGACTLIVEEETHARNRGAKILGQLLGAGSSCVLDYDGNPDISRALVIAMRAALNDAGVSPEEIGHINAHGLGARHGDRLEAEAIHEVFGPVASQVPVTSLKSALGNSGAGCGTLEIAASLLGLQHGVIPATLNYRQPDPKCNLNVVTELTPPKSPLVLKLSYTRIGQASALVFRGEP
jgi:3-oxoacyl-[acyl-carrier-protein] synthase II